MYIRLSHLLSFTRKKGYSFLTALLLLSFSHSELLAEGGFTDPNYVREKVAIKENLGDIISLDFVFTDTDNAQRSLREIFNTGGNKLPVILVPVYYRCPKLCNLTLNGLVDAINQSDFKLGKDYRVVAITINPGEGPAVARSKAYSYYNQLKPASFITSEPLAKKWVAAFDKSLETLTTENSSEKIIIDEIKSEKFTFSDADRPKYSLYDHMRFLTGKPQPIREIMQEVGFGYLKSDQDYAHKPVLIFISPDGKISRYFHGVQFAKRDFDLALTEAGQGKVGSFLQQALLFCFKYTKSEGYTADMWLIMRIVCSIIAVSLATFVFVLWRKEKDRKTNETIG